MEAAGIGWEEVGPDVKDFKVGDKMAYAGSSSWGVLFT